MSAVARALAWLARSPRSVAPDSGHAEVLAAYSAARARASEAEREKRRLRKLVDDIPAGDYDGWRKRFGTPAQVVDDDAVRELLAARGLVAPTKLAAAPVIVEYVGLKTRDERKGSN